MNNMKSVLSLALLCVAMLSCGKTTADNPADQAASIAANATTNLVPYRDGDKWGFARPDGSILVQPKYEFAYLRDDGFGYIYDKERTGLVSPEGKIISNFEYTNIGEFREGLAMVYTPYEQAGYIDMTGRLAIAAVYQEAYDFRNGIAVVKKNDQYLLLRKDGTVIRNMGALQPYMFDDYMPGGDMQQAQDKGFLLVNQADNYLAGLIDTTGKVVIKPIYQSLSHPINGVMVAAMGEKQGLISTVGKEITPLDYNFIYAIGVNRYMAERDGKYGILDEKGKTILPFEFTSLMAGAKGQYIASKDSLSGVLDATGKTVIPYKYSGLYYVFGAYNAYGSDMKSGVISTKGDVLIPLKYEAIETIRPGRYLVDVNGKRGLMDDKGAWLLQPEYDVNFMGGEEGGEMMDYEPTPEQFVLLFKNGVGTLFDTNGKKIGGDKQWLYGGYTNKYGYATVTDMNGRDNTIGPDGRIYAKDPVLKKVTVSTVQALFEAIGNDMEITLEDGVYDMSRVTGGSEYAVIFDFSEYDMEDRTIAIKNVRNLHLRAKNTGKVKLVTTYAFVPVLRIEGGFNISIQGMSIGHDIAPGMCDGAVLATEGVSGLTVNDCDLYGSGTVGLQAMGCSFIRMNNTVIRECTQGLLYLENTSDCRFSKCTMKDSGGNHLVTLSAAYEVHFDNVAFDNNQVPSDEYGPYDFFEVTNMYQTVNLTNCSFTNCKADYFASQPEIIKETKSARKGLTLKLGEVRPPVVTEE